jgi:NAD(P)H-quinone oxidoreductase subunit 5
MIVHKSSWRAALMSGRIALYNYIIGLIFLSIGFILLYHFTGIYLISEITNNQLSNNKLYIPLLFIVLAAMTQSAIIPFYRWLLSSLNCPTPVSALMHAGIVNGGGFLLIRFSPLYLNHPIILNVLFIIGLISALIGTLWKLMQSDVKRMLACSTIAQMGFMFIQCGLGFFNAALLHLCLHGLFKAYLFLASGSIVQERRLDLNCMSNIINYLFSLVFGVVGSYIYIKFSGIDFSITNTSIVLLSVVYIAMVQLSIAIINNDNNKVFMALLATIITSFTYSMLIYCLDYLIHPLNLMQAQKISFVHIMGLIVLFASWLLLIIYKNYKIFTPKWLLYLYVCLLNSSQPHHKTVTAHRKDYDYV